MNKNITILVNSCDFYEDAWYPFFKLMSIYWPESQNYKIVLHTETKKFDCDFLDVKTICSGNELSWTERLKVALDEIDTEYVLFFLEDFFIYEKVNNKLFEEMTKAFIDDHKLGVLWFPHYHALFHNENNSHYYNDLFVELSKHYISRVNLTISLWRKKYLLKMLFTNGSPWYFENCARTMSILLNSSGKAITSNKKLGLVFPVDQDIYGITKSKWLPKNQELFKQHNIYINFSKLGIISSGETFTEFNNNDKNQKRNFFQKALWYLKRNSKFIKRTIHIGPSFYKYCKKIDKEYK